MASSVLDSFRRNAAHVIELAEFDHFILDFCAQTLRGLDERLVRNGFTNPLYSPKSTIQALDKIREHDSLRPKYRDMFNQCVVLLVSYFSSALGDAFRCLARKGHATTLLEPLRSESVKTTFGDLSSNREDSIDLAVSLLLSQNKDINLQDMQSTVRSFQRYFGVTLSPGKDMNNVILGQAARHALVHSAGVVDKKMIGQVRDANPRALMTSVSEGAQISFAPIDVRVLATSMTDLLAQLSA